jgi:peptidoglycan-associated lipoprotein
MLDRGRVAWGTVALAALIACGGPKYPTCENDEHCNADGHKGVCVDRKCVACRDDSLCPSGQVCKLGSCVRAQGYCDDTTVCPGGAPCTNHACGSAPVSSGPPVECDDEHPCKGAGDRCQNGHCVGPDLGGPGCRDFSAPRFEYESAELSDVSKQTLQRLAGCLTTGSLQGRRVLLTGHCDNRGEYEFNMGLGADRAERARTFLTGLGVTADRVTTSSRGKLDAVGADEDSWSKDRRVDIEVR